MPDLTTPAEPAPAEPPSEPLPAAQVSALVDAWLAAGIITDEQAARMRPGATGVPEAEGARAPTPHASLAVEALGYLGGVIVIVSTMLIAAEYWRDISTAWRLALVGGASIGLLLGGFAVPDRLGAMGTRLRSALWLAATATAAGFLAVLAHDVLTLSSMHEALFVVVGSALIAAALWTRHRVIAQQVAMMGTAMAAAGVAVADLVSDDGWPGVGVWGVAAVWLLLGQRDLLRPRRAAMTGGAAGMVVGAMMTTSYDAGIVFALLTATGLVVTAVLLHDLLLLVVGGAGTLVVLPAALTEWFPDSRAAPFVLLVVGLLLVAAALWTARRRTAGEPVSARPQDRSGGGAGGPSSSPSSRAR